MFPFQRCQLVNGIEKLFLDASPGIQVRGRNNILHHFVHALRAAVPISDRVADQLVRVVQQDEIYRPGVNPDGLRDFSRLLTGFQSAQNSAPQVLHVPAVMAVAVNLLVIEAVHFFQKEFAVLHMPQNVPSAGCSNVNCKTVSAHASASFVLSVPYPITAVPLSVRS